MSPSCQSSSFAACLRGSSPAPPEGVLLAARAAPSWPPRQKVRAEQARTHILGRPCPLDRPSARIPRLCRKAGRTITSGRAHWLSRDPIGENGGVNLYAYTDNRPLTCLDPLGLTSVSDFVPPPQRPCPPKEPGVRDPTASEMAQIYAVISALSSFPSSVLNARADSLITRTYKVDPSLQYESGDPTWGYVNKGPNGVEDNTIYLNPNIFSFTPSWGYDAEDNRFSEFLFSIMNHEDMHILQQGGPYSDPIDKDGHAWIDTYNQQLLNLLNAYHQMYYPPTRFPKFE